MFTVMSIVRGSDTAADWPAGPIRARGSHILWLAWREARPAVQIIFLLRFFSGVALAAESAGSLPWKSVAPTAACWLATTTTVYLVNGISDIPGDTVNRSTRPLASGALPSRSATIIAVATALFAVATAALAGGAPTVALTLAMLTLGCAYSLGRHPLKNRMSGFLLTVVAGGMLTYLAGWTSVAPAAWYPEFVLFAVAMSAWMGFGGATKDLSDVDGDRLGGRRTWPVVLGERRARLAMAASALCVGAGFLVTALLAAPALLAPGGALLAGSLLLAVTVRSNGFPEGRNTRRQPYKVFMITQYIAHATLLSHVTLW